MGALIFRVVAGAGGFKIVDDADVIFGSFLIEDEADLTAARLNRKVVPIVDACKFAEAVIMKARPAYGMEALEKIGKALAGMAVRS